MKKLLSLVLAMMMLLAAMPALADAPADDLSKHRTMTAFLAMDDYRYFATKDQSPVVQYLMDKFNFTIEFQQPPVGSETDSFNQMLGGGDHNDLI